jgi:hypothetical protein
VTYIGFSAWLVRFGSRKKNGKSTRRRLARFKSARTRVLALKEKANVSVVLCKKQDLIMEMEYIAIRKTNVLVITRTNQNHAMPTGNSFCSSPKNYITPEFVK